jgi:cytosine/adenosine deaminase-related metal-dependent hydrolase
MGRSADVVSLDAEHPALLSRVGDTLLDSFVFAAGRGAVDCVWRRGTKVVSGGKHHARDAIAARYRATLARLR